MKLLNTETVKTCAEYYSSLFTNHHYMIEKDNIGLANVQMSCCTKR